MNETIEPTTTPNQVNWREIRKRRRESEPKPIPTKEKQPQRFRNMKLYEQALANIDTKLLGIRLKKCFHNEDNVRCRKHRLCTRCCYKMRKRRWKKVAEVLRSRMKNVHFYSITLTLPHKQQDTTEECSRQLELALDGIKKLFHTIDVQNERNKNRSPYVGVIAGLHPNCVSHWHIHWHIILAVKRTKPTTSTMKLAKKFCARWASITDSPPHPQIIKPAETKASNYSLMLAIEECHRYALNPWEIDGLEKALALQKLLKKRRTYRRKGIFR